jgi:transposase-like protein
VATEKKTGGLPAGIFSATTRPDPEAVEPVEQGVQLQADDAPAEAKGSKARKKKATAATGADVGDDGAKLYLTPDVRFRLRMLAYQRGKKISAVANEVLDKALPRWTLERTE